MDFLIVFLLSTYQPGDFSANMRNEMIFLALLATVTCCYCEIVEWPLTLHHGIQGPVSRTRRANRVGSLPLVDPPFHSAGYMHLNNTIGAKLFYFYFQVGWVLHPCVIYEPNGHVKSVGGCWRPAGFVIAIRETWMLCPRDIFSGMGCYWITQGVKISCSGHNSPLSIMAICYLFNGLPACTNSAQGTGLNVHQFSIFQTNNRKIYQFPIF